MLDYVSSFRDRLHHARSLATETLGNSQLEIKARLDWTALDRRFKIGDKVLALLPVPGLTLSIRFAGPYSIHQKLSDTDYVVGTLDRN